MTLEKIQDLLFEQRSPSVADLVDLATCLPDSLLARAIWIARNVKEPLLQALLIKVLAGRLPTGPERRELLREYPVPRGSTVKDVSIPAAKEACRLISQLTFEQRYQVLDQFLCQMEVITGVLECAKPKMEEIEFPEERMQEGSKSVGDPQSIGNIEIPGYPRRRGKGRRSKAKGIDVFEITSKGLDQPAGGSGDLGGEAPAPPDSKGITAA